MIHIMLDTDIGDDIDDALALAMILNSDELDLLGVTTVHGEVDIRSQLAARILHVADKGNIPVAAGIGKPFASEPRLSFIKGQAKILDGIPPYKLDSRDGVTLLADMARQCAGQLTLVGIGPLTNIALFVKNHSDYLPLLRELVIMGGNVHSNSTEYNIAMDPEAAQIVFHSGIPMRVVPFNITESCKMGDTIIEALFADQRPLQSIIGQLVDKWQTFCNLTYPVLHDPLAIGCLIAPELYTFESFDVDVVLTSGRHRGLTIGNRNPASNIRVCTSVDYATFLDLFCSLLLPISVSVR